MQTGLLKSSRTFDFPAYTAFVTELSDKKSCTGEATEDHIQLTLVNAYRIKRIDRLTTIRPEIKQLIRSVSTPLEWTVLVESWCGDGAQNLPVIAKMAELSDKISLKIVLRDENPKLMDHYLTNGARAIPKLICTNKVTGEELGTWGPRPAKIQEEVLKFKSQHPGVPHSEFMKNLQLWYTRDKGEALQDELAGLLRQWIQKTRS